MAAALSHPARAGATGLLLVCGLLGPLPEAMAQRWSVEESDAPVHWRACRIVSPGWSGPCSVTFVTRGQQSINIHFDRDDSGMEGLSFVIAAAAASTAGPLPFELVAARFGSNRVIETTGQCSPRPEAIRCISRDGRFSAQAAARLR
ncbi:MAG: hypothetical protein ACKO0M_02630 [Cyanobium sp.]